MSLAATATGNSPARKKLVGRWDFSLAFFHAPSTLKVAVVPPPDIDNGMYWWLQKAMNGTREASKQWGDQVTHVMVNIGGFHEIVVCLGTFYHAHLDVMIAVHGDDFIGSGTAEISTSLMP